MLRNYRITIDIPQIEHDDQQYVGYCTHCGKDLYTGDLIYRNKGIGKYCPDCFFNYLIPDLLTEA